LALWERNNVLKPDGNAGHFFSYSGNESYYSEGVDHFFGGPNICTLEGTFAARVVPVGAAFRGTPVYFRAAR